MQRMLWLILCMVVCGCGKPTYYEENPEDGVVTGSVLVESENQMKEYVNGEVAKLSGRIGNCEISVAALRGEYEAHRDATNALLRADGTVPITTDLLKEMKAVQDERIRERLRKQNGGGSSQQLVAYNPQSSVPPQPSYDPPGQPPVEQQERSPYVVTSRAPGCIAIHDSQTGRDYQWRHEGSGWRLVICQKNYCGKHGCPGHPTWVYTNPPQDFPQPQ